MKRLRIRVLLLVYWLVALFSLGHFQEVLFADGVAYLLAFLVLIITLVKVRSTRFTLPVLLTLALSAVTLLKAWGWVSRESFSLPLTVIEAVAVAVTVSLAYWVSLAMGEFEGAVAHFTIGRADRIPEPERLGCGSVYREVRRARNHQRPLSLMAIGIEETSARVALDRMVQEAQLSMMKQYVLSRIAKTLCNELEDCDVVVQSNNHFLIALPETTVEDLPRLVERLRQAVSSQVGVDLRIGTASLPEDGYTYEGLLEKVTDEMQEGLRLDQLLDFASFPVKN